MQAQAQYVSYPPQQGYSYQQQQPQQSSYGGYPSHQQQQQQLLAQFDPYANLTSSTTATSSIPGTFPNGPVVSSTQAQQQPPPGVQHPRAFIHSHKAELEAWDPPTWRQVQSSFEALKAAWETRKHVAEAQVRALGGTVGAAPASTGFFGGGGGYGGYGMYSGGVYQSPQAQEIDRLNAVRASSFPFLFFYLCFFDMRVCLAVFIVLQLIKEADSNIGTPFSHSRGLYRHVTLKMSHLTDTIAAGALQMAEVFGGYRHSGDIASKRRVRESCNAAVTGLPDYPPPTL
jgi:hypothetical protein